MRNQKHANSVEMDMPFVFKTTPLPQNLEQGTGKAKSLPLIHATCTDMKQAMF